VTLFCERASEYSATVTRCAPAEVAVRIGEICTERGMKGLFVSALEEWGLQPPGVELFPDEDLSVSELDSGPGVMTACAVAIAETGTVVLDGGPGQGRRALTLVPDMHLCVVPAERIVELVPEAVARLAPSAREGRALTFISGPSATADIEFDRVEGVHGPRDLVLLVVDEAQSGIDRGAGPEVEEVDPLRLDRERDLAADGRSAGRVEARQEDGSPLPGFVA
jgi:L-lactate dehydrogenase complex protein LldG